MILGVKTVDVIIDKGLDFSGGLSAIVILQSGLGRQS